jgi:hypothetical protein
MKETVNVSTVLVEDTNVELLPMYWARLTNLDFEPITVMENVVLHHNQPVTYGPFDGAKFQLSLNPSIMSPDSKIKIRIEYAAD